MAKPLHVLAFEQFKNNNDDPLKAYVAFGLYIEAEYKWASSLPAWPSDGRYKTYYQCSLPHSVNNYENSADQILIDFANGVVAEHSESFLQQANTEVKEELSQVDDKIAELRTLVHGIRHAPWWKGVLEATGGAILWSAILIIATIIAGRLGIDVLGGFERAAGVQEQQHNHP